mmetsp:Transcript_27670/g.63959  ORF Transcript_27670/g.63959 Transcript_27670/m.63959 type:complete len:211 (+) Transcript_27670:95-727(+)
MFCSCCETEDAAMMHTVDSVAVATQPERDDEPDEPISDVDLEATQVAPILPLAESNIATQPSVTSGRSSSKPLNEVEPLKEADGVHAADSTTSDAKVVETASTQPPEEDPDALPVTDFIVTVTRSQGEKLGLVAYNNSGESFLRIRAIKPVGLIAKWNEEHPDKIVRVDFLILSVNGNETPSEMRKTVTDSSVLGIDMTLRRSVPQTQAE